MAGVLQGSQGGSPGTFNVSSPTPNLSTNIQGSPSVLQASQMSGSSGSSGFGNFLKSAGGALLNGVTGALSGGPLGLVSGLIGGLFGNHSAKKQAEQQMKMQQAQNEFNAREAQKNRDFQKLMQDEQNQYNSASAQRKRLEDAGLNPYLMMNGGDAGTASGATASGAQASGTPGQAVGYQPQISMNPLSAAQIENLNAQTELTKAQAGRVRSESNNLDASASLAWSRAENQDMLNYIFRVYGEGEKKLDLQFLRNKVSESSIAVDLSSIQRDIQSYYRDNVQPQELNNLIAEEVLKKATANNVDFQTERGQKLLSLEMGYLMAQTSLARSEAVFNWNSMDLRLEGLRLDNQGKIIGNGKAALEFQKINETLQAEIDALMAEYEERVGAAHWKDNWLHRIFVDLKNLIPGLLLFFGSRGMVRP